MSASKVMNINPRIAKKKYDPKWRFRVQEAESAAKEEKARTGGPKTIAELIQWKNEGKDNELIFYAAKNPNVMSLMRTWVEEMKRTADVAEEKIKQDRKERIELDARHSRELLFDKKDDAEWKASAPKTRADMMRLIAEGKSAEVIAYAVVFPEIRKMVDKGKPTPDEYEDIFDFATAACGNSQCSVPGKCHVKSTMLLPDEERETDIRYCSRRCGAHEGGIKVKDDECDCDGLGSAVKDKGHGQECIYWFSREGVDRRNHVFN